MEDVLYTLNNIVDDIASMYAGSPDGLDAASLEADEYVEAQRDLD
jgi:hypothetical protein